MASEFLQLRMPSVSRSGLQVLDMLSGDDFDIIALTDAISGDPVLSSAVLKYANAPLYRRMVEVTNVRQAISILGFRNVRLAVMVASMRSFSREHDEKPLATALWAHSFSIAALCKVVAQMVRPAAVEDIELTGLLHEMGGLILLANFPDEYERVAASAMEEAAYIEDREKAFFGVSHNELLGRMLDELRLPDVTLAAIADFPTLDEVAMLGRDVDYHLAVLALAHHIDSRLGRDERHPNERVPDTLEGLADKLGLGPDEIDSLEEQYRAIREETYRRVEG